MKKIIIVLLSLFSACTLKLGSDNVVTTKPTITVNGSDVTTLVPSQWCSHIPLKYQHYFPNCVADATISSVPVLAPLYSIASNWNDYIKSDGSSLCVGTESNYDSCLNGGELRQVITGETSCTGLSLTDSLGSFDWTCTLSSGVAVFTSKMKTNKGLNNLISGTSWLAMSVTLTKGTSHLSSASSTQWSNSITTLPNNSTTGASVAVLNSAGTVYVTSTDVNTSGYNIQADKVSVVALNGATIFHNATLGQNAHVDGSVGNDARTVLATGSHKFLWIEGNYDMNGPDSGGSWTIFVSGTAFSKLKLVNSYRGYPIYLYQVNNSVVESTSTQNSVDFGMEMDTSNNNEVLNYVSVNNTIHYGLGVANSNNNYVYNLRSTDSAGGIRVYSGSHDNIFDEVYIENVYSGIYTPYAGTNNVYSNVTVDTVTNPVDAGFNIQNADGQILTNILIKNAPNGIMFQISHDTLVSEIHVQDCGVAFFTYDGTGTDISDEVWYDSNTSNCSIVWGNAGYASGSCNAANDSTFTIVSSSSNIFGYQL